MNDTDCTHHWLLDALPVEGIVHGRCWICGAIYERPHPTFSDSFNAALNPPDVGAITAGALRSR